MKPRQTLQAFDDFLAQRERSLSAIIVGGGALSLMGVITRETQDIDVIDPILTQEILTLAREFADKFNLSSSKTLKKEWLNNGPESLRKNLPNDWTNRIQPVFSGKALTLYTLGRPDFLKTKLFAFCDREQDRQDCLLMKPMRQELNEALIWIQQQDQHPGWPNHVESSLKSLAKELGYEF